MGLCVGPWKSVSMSVLGSVCGSVSRSVSRSVSSSVCRPVSRSTGKSIGKSLGSSKHVHGPLIHIGFILTSDNIKVKINPLLLIRFTLLNLCQSAPQGR